jgi:hypothetical protein
MESSLMPRAIHPTSKSATGSTADDRHALNVVVAHATDRRPLWTVDPRALSEAQRNTQIVALVSAAIARLPCRGVGVPLARVAQMRHAGSDDVEILRAGHSALGFSGPQRVNATPAIPVTPATQPRTEPLMSPPTPEQITRFTGFARKRRKAL